MEGGELVNLNYNNLTDIPNKLLEENLFRKKLEKLYLKQNLIVQLVSPLGTLQLSAYK